MLLFICCIFALTLAQSPIKVPPQMINGIEYINMVSPTLANMANLAYDPNSSPYPAFYFTADKSNPNIWTARVDDVNGKSTWWLEPQQKFQTSTLSPFLSIDVVNDTIIGACLPNTINDAGGYDTALSAIHYDGVKNQTGTQPLNFAGYSFYALTVSRTKNAEQPTPTYYGYAVGWADDDVSNNTGFFIARFQVTTLGQPNPSIIFDADSDVLTNITATNCYDLYTTVKKPVLFVDEAAGFLWVAITGRCSEIVKIQLPPVGTKFATAQKIGGFLLSDTRTYFASASRNIVTNVLFCAVASYDRSSKTNVISIDLNAMVKTTAPTLVLDFNGQALPILQVAIDATDHNLYALAADTNQIHRFVADPTSSALVLAGVANLPQSFQEIGSVNALGQYLYFTTYGPDASIARVHKTISFCLPKCDPVYGYCNNGVCDCQTPWQKVSAANGTFTCQNPVEIITKEKEVANEKAAIVFGVFFAITTIVAVAGWFKWWQGQNVNYQQL